MEACISDLEVDKSSQELIQTAKPSISGSVREGASLFKLAIFSIISVERITVNVQTPMIAAIVPPA